MTKGEVGIDYGMRQSSDEAITVKRRTTGTISLFEKKVV